MNRTRSDRLKSFRRDERGNVAMLFALGLIPMLGLVGAAIDYSRATDQRAKLHRAADAAALAAAKARNLSLAEKRALGRKVFEASLAGDTELTDLYFHLTEVGSGVRVDVSGASTNAIMRAVGFDLTKVGTFAEAVTTLNPTEVALVLDNTGSMKNDMVALRKAAKDFTETLFGNANGYLKMAVVPYVAAVNPGRTNMAMGWMDTGASSRWHGHHLENREIAWMDGCDSNPFPKPTPPVVSSTGNNPPPAYNPPPSTPSPPKPPPPQDRPPKGKDRSVTSLPGAIGALALELFGIKSASAQVTPLTDSPNSGTDVTPGAPYRTDGGTSKLPNGFIWDKPCKLRNPPKISHFDLFQRVAGTSWKGCVEARPEPYDVNDDAPVSSNPDTLFVPYFWPDEPGNEKSNKFANSYLPDGDLPPGWSRGGGDEGKQFANLFKYTQSASSEIKENGPGTKGPNASCPDPILPLTDQKATVLSKIGALNHWEGGGTFNSEGVMWGWRVLSPTAPFTEGAAYKDAKKYLVLMSDGMNSFVANHGGPVKSDYTAYGYLKDGRLPSDWFTKGEEYLDGRMKLACANAKQTGIKILTVLFRETDPNTINLMRDCASESSFAYLASSETELRRAFEEIAGEITKLRLSK